MTSRPPDPDGLDSGWEAEGSANAEARPAPAEGSDDASTRLVDPKEIFDRAGFRMDQKDVEGRPRPAGRGRSEGRITARAPRDEYADHVNKARPSSQSLVAVQVPRAPPVGESFEETLDALLAEKSLALECDEPGTTSVPGGIAFEPVASVRDRASEDLLGGIVDPYPAPERGSEPGARGRAGAAPPPDVDFQLDLGIELPDLDTEDPTLERSTQPPITPPPGTLRLGLIEEEGDISRGQDWLERASEASSQQRGRLPISGPLPASAAPRQPPAGEAWEPASVSHTKTLVPGARTLFPAPRASAPPRPALGGAGRGAAEALLGAEGTGATTPQKPAPTMAALEGLRPSAPPTARVTPTPDERRRQMLQRFEAGDFGGALVLAEALLDEAPGDPTAQRYADSCNEMLRQMYRSKIGDGSKVLRILISPEEIRSLSLDHRAGFLLSCIDGMSSIDDVLDVSGMGELEALRILYELVQQSIIAPGDG